MIRWAGNGKGMQSRAESIREWRERALLEESLQEVLKVIPGGSTLGPFTPLSDMRKHRLCTTCGVDSGEFEKCLHYAPTTLGNCIHLAENGLCFCGEDYG